MYKINSKMDIPTEIPNRINPLVQDYVSKSVIYTFDTKDVCFDKDGNILYRFPYSRDTFWTNFKYSCYNITKEQNEELEFEIIVITTDEYEYTIKSQNKYSDKTWYDMDWVMPSVNTLGSPAGIYFKVKPISDKKSMYNIVMSVLGFTELFPKSEYYLLNSPLDTHQFVLSKFETNPEYPTGSIYNIEHYDYIREIIPKSHTIYMTKHY